MVEGEVDHPVGAGGAGPQEVQVVQVTAEHLGSGSLQFRRGGVRTGEANDLMTSTLQLGNDGGADPTGRAGNEDTH